MKKNDSCGDNWALLASELGVDDPNIPVKIDEQILAEPQTQTVASTAMVDIVAEETFLQSEPDSFGKGLLDDKSETQPTEIPEETLIPPKPREGRKNFFDRFPKINLFGASTKESLAAVVESVKAPSLSGKSFTSSKLEKVPVSQERAARREKDHKPFELDDSTPTTVVANTEPIEISSITSEQTSAIINVLDPWSKIASQVGSLSVTPPSQVVDSKSIGESLEKKKSWEKPVNNDQEPNDNVKHHRRGRSPKTLPSMFDEPALESEEAVILKSLIGTDHYGTDEAERRLRSMFDEEVKSIAEPEPIDDTQRREPKHYPKQREKSHGSRFKDRQPETRENARENIKEKPFAVNLDEDFDRKEKEGSIERREYSSNRERGRRGSRFEQREESRFPKTDRETIRSEISETTWDIEDESKPVERSLRGRRRRERTEEPFQGKIPVIEKDVFETETSTSEDYDLVQLHKNIPSWDDAINLLIESNIARHAQQGASSNSRNNKGRR